MTTQLRRRRIATSLAFMSLLVPGGSGMLPMAFEMPGAQERSALPSCGAPLKDPVTTVDLPGGHPTPTSNGCWVFASFANRDRVPGRDGIAVLRRTADGFEEMRAFAMTFVRQQQGALSPTTFAMALTPDDKMLIVSNQTQITFLDVTRLISGGDPILGTLSSPRVDGSWGLSITSDSSYAFVAQARLASVLMIDLARVRTSNIEGTPTDEKAIVAIIRTAPQALFPLVSPDGRFLFNTALQTPDVIDGPRTCIGGKEMEGAVQVNDVERAKVNARTAPIAFASPAGCRPQAMALSPDGNRLSVAAGGLLGNAASAAADTSVVVFDTRPAREGKPPALIGRIPMSAAPTALADNGTHLVAGFYHVLPLESVPKAAHLTVMDPSKAASGRGAIIGTLPFPSYHMRFSADGRTLFASHSGWNRLVAIDLGRARLEPLGN